MGNKSKFNFLDIESLRQLSELAGCNDNRTQKVLKAVLQTGDPELAESFGNFLIHKAADNIVNPRIYYQPTVEAINGNLKVGISENGLPFGINPEELTGHAAVFGMTGAGKSYLINYNIIPQLIDAGTQVLIFSFSKREARNLLFIQKDILILDAGGSDFVINLLEMIPGVSQLQLDGAFADVFSNQMAILAGSMGFIFQTLQSFREVYPASDTAIPSIPDYYEYLLDYQQKLDRYSADARYCERVLSRLLTLLSATGRMLHCSRGWHLYDLTQKLVIIELHSILEPNVQNFMAEMIITIIYLYRLMSNRKFPLLVMVLEEAHRLFDVNKSRRPAAGRPTISVLIDTIRALKVGFIFSAPSPMEVIPNLVTNSNTKIMMKLGSGLDVQMLGRSMAMTQEQIEVAGQLSPRTAVVTTYKNPLPFLVKLNDVSVCEKQVSNEDVAALMEPIYKDAAVLPRVPYSEIAKNRISEIEEKFLLHIANNRLSPIVIRYAAINVPVDRGNRMKKRLLQIGMIRQIELALGKKGGVVKLLSLTEIGRDCLKQKGYNISHEGKGGIEHYFYQFKVKSFFERKGHSAEIEGSVNGHCVDVLVKSPDGNLLAVEVAATTRDWESVNLQKDLDAGFSKVVFACKNKEIQETLMKKFAPDGKLNPKVELALVKDYL